MDISPFSPASFIIQHPALFCTRRHTTQAGVCKAVECTKCEILSLSCLPQTGCCVFLQSLKGPFLPQLISPPWVGVSECGNLSSHQFPTRGAGPFPFPLFFFHTTQLYGDFVWGFPLVFRGCFMRTVPFVDVCLICL